MNPLLRLRHRLSTRMAVFVTILFLSATAVEVAPQAIDVLQDFGWLPPDAPDAPAAEAAALPASDETVVHLPAIEAITTVDDAAYDRLVQYAASQAGAFEEPVIYSAEVGALDEDQTDAASLLEGVVSLGGGPAAQSTPYSVNRSNPVGSMSVPTSGNLPTTATTGEETAPDGLPVTTTDKPATDESADSPSTQPGPAGAGRELFFVLSENPTTGGMSQGKTTSAGQTEASTIATTASFVEPTPESAPFPTVTLALVPQPEFGTDTGASLEISAVPEPATLLMLGTGLLFVARYGRRKVAR